MTGRDVPIRSVTYPELDCWYCPTLIIVAY
jgi:hypothetical protein